MKYLIKYSNPHNHYIDITCIVEDIAQAILEVHLPAWRPGRYELGNFAKNIQQWKVTDENGNALASSKISKDHWKIETKGQTRIYINYNYYAAELNAGSTYVDATMLYVNPVNCLLYVKEKMNESHVVELTVPVDYEVATSLRKERGLKKCSLTAKNYDELADSPFIASNTLQHNHFIYEGIEFNLWFQGECRLDWGKIIGDFFIFVNEQYEMFREFPSNEYHFLFHVLPYKFHHGVEHLKSTVIALGPGYNLLSFPLYNEFLGVSSHELFHSWNIKSIRPVEMFPYDFSRENYSVLGYVAEGVTTYYGDLMLYRSRIFSDDDFSKEFSDNFQRHFDNFGRCYRSLEESSFDTWLDGYGKGIPNRVMSIYPDGCLVAFMTDIHIRNYSENKYSLDDVMRMLYYEYAKKGKGYSETDYKKLIEAAAGKNFDAFFETYIRQPLSLTTEQGSYEAPLIECLDYIGWELIKEKSKKFHEAHWGIKSSPTSPLQKERGEIISSIYPGSAADLTGLSINDEIISINGFELKNDLADWSRYFSFKEARLMIKRNQQVLELEITPSKDIYFCTYTAKKMNAPSALQKENFENWSRRKF